MATYKPDLKAECIRLRTQERKSFREIEALTGASKGSLSLWLKSYPLGDDEVAERKKGVVRYRPPKKDRGEQSKYHEMAEGRNLDPNQKAKVAEAAVLLRLTVMGFEVFRGTHDGTKADWIALVPATGKLWKIQVKLTRSGTDGLPYTLLRCSQSARKYEAKDIDCIVGYDLFTDTAYVWTWAEVEHLSTTVSITPDAAERWDKME